MLTTSENVVHAGRDREQALATDSQLLMGSTLDDGLHTFAAQYFEVVGYGMHNIYFREIADHHQKVTEPINL